MLVAVRLLDEALWSRFHDAQNEMIITRNGRCLFPLLRLEFEAVEDPDPFEITLDLNPAHRYSIGMSIVEADLMRWRYRSGVWHPVLSSSISASSTSSSQTSSQQSVSSPMVRLRTAQPVHVYEPGLSMAPHELMHGGVSFARVKLSNRPYDSTQRLQTGPAFSLASFHRYIPMVHVLDRDEYHSTGSLAQVVADQPTNRSLQSFSFPITSFIAVTHYQNDLVTLLKKSYNPHAKGFLVRSPVYEEGSTDDDQVYEQTSDLSQEEMLALQTLANMSSPI